MTDSDFSPNSKFTSDELYVPGFLWHNGYPVAVVKKHYRVQFLLPFELLRKYPHYSASFNGFLELSSSLTWFSPVFVTTLARVWANRYFGSTFNEDFDRLKKSVRNLFGFHTGYPDLSRRVKHPIASEEWRNLAGMPLEDSFERIRQTVKASDLQTIYEVTPLWSNHVKHTGNKDSAMRVADLRVKTKALIEVQTSKALVLARTFIEDFDFNTLLGFGIRKFDTEGSLKDYWFIPRQKIRFDALQSQTRNYLVNYELAERLTLEDEENIKVADVDKKLDEIAWSKDRALDLQGLEEIAILMLALEYPEASLTHTRHILHDLFVDDLALTEAIEKIEALSGGRHTAGNVKKDLFENACRERAVEFTGARAKLPLSEFYVSGARLCSV